MKNNLSYTLSENLSKSKNKLVNYDSLKTKIMNTKTE